MASSAEDADSRPNNTSLVRPLISTPIVASVEFSWAELMSRITAVQPVPEPETVSVLALVAVGFVLLAWPVTRMVITIVHEAGHAAIAVLTGRKLTGIRLHSDTSGLTLSRGRPRGPGMVATLLAGYLAPGVLGFGAAWLLSSGRAALLLALLVIVMAAMLVMIRNLFGLVVLVVGLAVVGGVVWYLQPVQQSLVAYLLTWTLLLAAPRPVLEMSRQKSRNSDAAQLARLTRIPTVVWTGLFLVGTIATLLAGLGVLVPGLVHAAG